MLPASTKRPDARKFERLPPPVSVLENEPPSIYGRFDLMYNGAAPPKLLE